MCGFAGILNSPENINIEQVAPIASKVSFRGPDHCSIRFYGEDLRAQGSGNNMVFFNRLAVMDLDQRANQPFEDARYTLLFNGEIYNFKELQFGLEAKGYRFKTTSDTEVLFYALQEWGLQALDKLNGMFAICWIDRLEKKFMLARDRLGIKPLYYSHKSKSLVFASELDSIMRLSATKLEIEPRSVQMYLWMQFIPTPYTIVQGAYKLPPGHYLLGSWDDIQNGDFLKTTAFWDGYTNPQEKNSIHPDSSLETVLRDSLSRQLIADVPVGLFLSSGVDSSLLAAMLNKHFTQSRQFNFFTVAFSQNTASDESKDAQDFIRGFDNPSLVSHRLTIDSSVIGNLLDHLYNYFDEPFGDEASLLNWAISRKARDFVKVALSGDGADELFWGYRRYDHWQNPSLHFFGGKSILSPLTGLIKPFLPGRYRKNKAKLELELNPVHRHFTLFLDPELIHLMENPVWGQTIWAMEGIEKLHRLKDLTARMDLKTYLSDAMLHKVDRASMAASLEVRVPYLDNVVMDYALAMPFTSKSNPSHRHKASLKILLQELAPHYPINRPKKGFNFPLDNWLRLGWKSKVLSLVNKENLVAMGLDETFYLPMVKQYYKGDKRLCKAVWYLFNLVLWGQKYKNINPL